MPWSSKPTKPEDHGIIPEDHGIIPEDNGIIPEDNGIIRRQLYNNAGIKKGLFIPEIEYEIPSFWHSVGK